MERSLATTRPAALQKMPLLDYGQTKKRRTPNIYSNFLLESQMHLQEHWLLCWVTGLTADSILHEQVLQYALAPLSSMSLVAVCLLVKCALPLVRFTIQRPDLSRLDWQGARVKSPAFLLLRTILLSRKGPSPAALRRIMPHDGLPSTYSACACHVCCNSPGFGLLGD